MADILLRSEVLCFIQNALATMLKAFFLTVLCGFYSIDGIIEAKNILFKVAENLKSDGSITIDLPRNVVRRTEGDGRRRLDSDDILELWTVLDAAKDPFQRSLPLFENRAYRRLR